jgi:hypothetical protein
MAAGVLPPPDKIATGAKYNAEDDVSAEEQFHWKMILENDPVQAIAKRGGLRLENAHLYVHRSRCMSSFLL